MDLFACCITCSQKKGFPFLNQFSASYFDDQIARVTCNQGHEMAIIVYAPKYELLLESGADALNYDFTLEASASFSAALERFFEFSINVMLKNLNMQGDVYQTMFNSMSRQSERQLGAFFVLHALVFGEAYKPNKNLTEFRNAVIHKGKIPTPEETKQFCELVYSEIYKVANLLIDRCKNEITLVLDEEFEKRASKINDDIRVHRAKKSSVFSILGDNNKPTFEKAFENYNSFKKTLEKVAKDIPSIQQHIESNSEIQSMINEIRTKE